jgi:hypothetical protein
MDVCAYNDAGAEKPARAGAHVRARTRTLAHTQTHTGIYMLPGSLTQSSSTIVLVA